MRIAIENSTDCILNTGGGLESVVRLTGVWKAGNKGTTFNPTFIVNYIAYDSTGTPFPGTHTESWITGINNFSFTETETGESLPVSGVLNIADTLEVTNTPGLWYYDQDDVQVAAIISGGGYSETLPDVGAIANYQLTKEYIGPYLPELGWGDYSLSASITDPNGVVTQASNNGAITALWSPFAFITKVDGSTNMRDSLPPVTSSSVQVEYTYSGTFALDENGNPVYDENGAIANIGGLTQSESVTLVEGNNTIGPFTTPVDSAGKTVQTDSKSIAASIPTFTAWDDSGQFYGIIGYEDTEAWDDSEQFYAIIGEL
jgi:hypothetical protein